MHLFSNIFKTANHLFLLASLALSATAALALENGPFYRIIEGPRPAAEQVALDKLLYGTEVLYTEEAMARPTVVKGTVWHATLKEASFYVGTHNPVIENAELLTRIASNKWEEAKLLMHAIPDDFPKTESMAEVLTELKSKIVSLEPEAALEVISAELKKRYPEGFFLKPIEGFNSVGTFPTEKTNFREVFRGYLKQVKPRAIEILNKTGDPDEIHFKLKEMKDYSGRVLEALLEKPESVIIQSKIKPALGSTLLTENGPKSIVEEYRIHIVEGRVLPNANQNRWVDGRGFSPENLHAAERFAQSVMNRLPKEYRKLCFGMDVMRTENGLFKVIELNPGGESAYLYPETDIWVTHQLAARYLGHPTELMGAVHKMHQATGLFEKEKAFLEILHRNEILSLKGDIEPITEILVQAKNAFLDELKSNPSSQTTLEILYLLKKYKLQSTLTRAEVHLLAEAAGNARSFSPSELSALLGLQANEPLFKISSPTGIQYPLLELKYDDAFVTKKCSDIIIERLKREVPDPTDRVALKKLIQNSLENTVLTRRQIQLNPHLVKKVGLSRFYYSGSKEGLARAILKEIAKARP